MQKRPLSGGLARAHLIASVHLLLNHDESLLDLFFDPKTHGLRDEGKGLFKRVSGLSRQEALLLGAAQDMWNASGQVKLSECLEAWDYQAWIQFIRSLCHLVEIRQDVIESLEDDMAE